MSNRPIFKGAIALGSFIIPMAIVKATKEHDVSFHEYHKTDMGRVGRSKPCKVCGAILTDVDIIKGVEYAKNQVVSFSKDELDNLPLTSARTIDIDRFVGADEINPLICEEAYYVIPEEIGIKAYELFVKGLKKLHKVAVGKIALRQREHICAIAPMGNGLVLNTLFYADEVREMPEVPKAQTVEDEVELIGQVITKYTKPFEHTAYVDGYTEAIQTMIDAKLKGETPVVATAEIRQAKSLREALEDLAG